VLFDPDPDYLVARRALTSTPPENSSLQPKLRRYAFHDLAIQQYRVSDFLVVSFAVLMNAGHRWMDDGRMPGTSHNRTIWRTRRTTNESSSLECRRVYICGLEPIDLRVFEAYEFLVGHSLRSFLDHSFVSSFIQSLLPSPRSLLSSALGRSNSREVHSIVASHGLTLGTR